MAKPDVAVSSKGAFGVQRVGRSNQHAQIKRHTLNLFEVKEDAVEDPSTLSIDLRQNCEAFAVGNPDITEDCLGDVLTKQQ